MPDQSATSRIRLSGARERAPTPFDLRPGDGTRAALAAELGLDAVKKLRLTGELRPAGGQDWTLEAELGATIVQPCGITLAPVTTRIDETVRRRYLAALDGRAEPEEQEMPDDEAEPLPSSIDLEALMAEALSLAIPPFPRVEGAEMGEIRAAAPGAEPLGEEEAEKPFAGLAEQLRNAKS